MRYHLDYQLTHDIDWFAIYNDIPIHVASNGNVIPNNVDSKNNRLIQRYLENEYNGNVGIVINNNALGPIFETTDKGLYLESFIEFARKGFVSIDNNLEVDSHGNLFYRPIVVAYPQDRINLFDTELLRDIVPTIPEIGDNDLATNLLNLWRQ